MNEPILMKNKEKMEDLVMIFEKLKDIIAEQLSVEADEVNMDSNIQDDLGADSLDVVDLLMNIDDEFGVEVPDEDVEKVKTVEDLVAYIEARQ